MKVALDAKPDSCRNGEKLPRLMELVLASMRLSIRHRLLAASLAPAYSQAVSSPLENVSPF